MIRIGCSGWQYADWRGRFYPRELPARLWLEHYARDFDTVELNGTFYGLPDVPTVEAWRRRAPHGFLFAWKASRFLTHRKKLKDPSEPVARMMGRAASLRDKLGPILFQLPPRWRVNVDRLRELLRVLPRSRACAFEMRDPSWYDARVVALLGRAHKTLCLHDMPGSETGRRPVGSFVYVRFHGADQRYGGSYGSRRLAEWARFLADQAARGKDVYAYFNNDRDARAPRDAMLLRDAIARAS
jgi:uncharacterized protein YecE (DUF72 family)